MAISEPTAVFSLRDEKDLEIKQTMQQVYRALEEKGYNPINQIVGYILSEDPTYITTYKNARALIRRIDRDDLLSAAGDEFQNMLFRQSPASHGGAGFLYVLLVSRGAVR